MEFKEYFKIIDQRKKLVLELNKLDLARDKVWGQIAEIAAKEKKQYMLAIHHKI